MPWSLLNIVEIREIRLSVIRGRLPHARDVVKLCEQLENMDTDDDGIPFGASDDDDNNDEDDVCWEDICSAANEEINKLQLERDKLKVENERLVKMLEDAGYEVSK